MFGFNKNVEFVSVIEVSVVLVYAVQFFPIKMLFEQVPFPGLILVLLINVIIVKNTQGAAVNSPLGLTENRLEVLKEIALTLNASLDESADPCIDYYKYVCEKSNISDRLVQVFPSNDFINEVFDKSLKDESDLQGADLKAKVFFDSCSNPEEIGDFVRSFDFPDSIGGWSVFDPEWSGDNFDLTSAVAELNAHGIQFLIDLRMPIVEDRTYLIIAPEIIPSHTNLSTHSENMRVNMEKKLLTIGLENTTAMLDNYLTVEQNFLKQFPNNETVTKTIKTYNELKDWVPEFNWEKYFSTVAGLSFQEEDLFIVVNEEQIQELIAKLSTLDKNVLNNYLFCKFVDQILANMAGKGNTDCYLQVYNTFYPVFAKIIVTERFQEENRKRIIEALNLLVEVSDEFSLLDNEHDKNVIKQEIEQYINDDFISLLTPEAVNKEFENLEITAKGYYRNVLKVINRNVREIFERIYTAPKNPTQLRRFLEEFLLHAIYNSYNKPMSLLLNELDLLLYAASAARIKLTKGYVIPEATEECFKQQLEVDDLGKVNLWQHEILQKVTKAFNLWTKDNEILNDKENEILSEFGLSNKKLLLAVSLQETCVSKEKNAEFNGTIHQAAWANLKDFSDEYRCGEGTPMNPSSKCDLL